ncbi:MAG: HPP family protein [Bacillota bacterium]
MSTVKDYMMRTLNSVCADDTIEHVIEFMYKTEMTVFPVVDETNKFLGTLYSKKILKNIIPEQYGFMESHRILYEINQAAENMGEIKNRKVKDYMTTSITAVKETEDMNNLAHIMLSNDEQYLFVTNKQNKLRGYISRADLLYYLLKVSQGEDFKNGN